LKLTHYPSDVLVKYTYNGASDLNGVTTLDDFTLFLAVTSTKVRRCSFGRQVPAKPA
jgi:hypothetical protein